MSLTSSILNSVTFKDLSGSGLPNNWNTLHNDSLIGGFSKNDYVQKWPKGETIYLQFDSDVDTDLTLKIYNPTLADTQTISYNKSYTDQVTRYYFNVALSLGSEYQDKEIYITVQQGTDTLTSEPICISSLAEKLASREILRIRITNLDRYDSDLSSYFVDWPSILNTDKYFQFYIEAANFRINNSDDSEVLETTLEKVLVSGKFFSGMTLQTGIIPPYMVDKLTAASLMDYFEVNGKEYVRQDAVEVEEISNNTSYQASINLKDKVTQGINADDLGITTDDMEWHKEEIFTGVVSNVQATEPDKYYTALVAVLQNGSPSENPITIKMGYGGAGSSDIGTYRIYDNLGIQSIPINRRNSLSSSSTIYVTIPSVAGSSLEIRFNYQLQDIE